MTSEQSTDSPGLAARRIAAEIYEQVMLRKRPLDEAFDGAARPEGLDALEPRDRAFVHLLVATTLRRHGSLRALLLGFLRDGFPANLPRVETALLLGAVQLLVLEMPAHAAVDLSVRLVKDDFKTQHQAPLVNAVLRRVSREGKAALGVLDAVTLDTPAWLMTRWSAAYGEDAARTIAAANANEPALDLTVKSDAPAWAEKLGGTVLPTGSVRMIAHGPIPALAGFDEGAWWVQDAAAALPAKLFGDVAGKRIADLCAAPGGKSAQLAAMGAHVTCVDRSAPRMQRLNENLARLSLSAEIVVADATKWQPADAAKLDGILLDAPCLATGTIRRHPDIPWLKSEIDLRKLADLQTRLLDHAATLLKPGGVLVYCTCSLEREEGEAAIEAAMTRNPSLARDPIRADEIGGQAEFLNANGELRTLPHFWPHADSRLAGLDGFFAARLLRR